MQPARSLPRTAGGSFLCRQARGMAARGRGFSCGSGGSLAVGRCAGCSFPLAGKNQWAIRGSLFEPARALPTGTPPLGFRKESGAAQGCRFPRRGGLEQGVVMHVICRQPTDRPRYARDSMPLVAPGRAGEADCQNGQDVAAHIRRTAGGACATSVGLRRRSPSLSAMTERASMGEPGRPQDTSARARPTKGLPQRERWHGYAVAKGVSLAQPRRGVFSARRATAQ